MASAAFAMAACGAPAPPPETRLPNIVLIVPDDLGRHDVSFHGGEIATPNIDRIAAEGVLIERFYTAPICSPTRAGLLTGRYPIRYGLMRNVISPWQDFGLNTEEVTLPEVLARAGYEHRGVFGKWHLGHISRKYHPLRRGFTESVGHNTSIDYFTKERFGERDWFHGYEPASEEGYVTDLVAGHAVRFIDRHAGGETPFFLYVPFNAAHSPLQAKEEDLPLYADLEAIEPPRSWEEITAGLPAAKGVASTRRWSTRWTRGLAASSRRSTIATSRRTPSSSSSATTAAAPTSATTVPIGARRAPSSRAAHGSPRRRAGRRAASPAAAG
ncbi:MAG: sulfatase-like hydrolase/transferase [Acidobacteria bacterium]|nr:sulfatase-like hydrolase/transferase [Acidobacteriota bacterium]